MVYVLRTRCVEHRIIGSRFALRAQSFSNPSTRRSLRLRIRHLSDQHIRQPLRRTIGRTDEHEGRERLPHAGVLRRFAPAIHGCQRASSQLDEFNIPFLVLGVCPIRIAAEQLRGKTLVDVREILHRHSGKHFRKYALLVGSAPDGGLVHHIEGCRFSFGRSRHLSDCFVNLANELGLLGSLNL